MFNRLTPVVRNLILINVIVFVAQFLFSGLQLKEHLALWNPKTEYFQPYQLFTYMFAHEGFMHILFNMMALAFMGSMLESFWGQKKFLIFYIATGIGAGVFNLLVDMYFGVGSFGLMIGASGAVYGILTAFGMIFPNMEIMLLIPPIPIKAKYLAMILIGMALFLGLRNSATDNVAHFTHLGGVVVAFIIIKAWRSQGGGSYY